MMMPSREVVRAARCLAGAALALAVGGVGAAGGEEAKAREKKPYEHYKVIETQNIFSPPAPPAPPKSPAAPSSASKPPAPPPAPPAVLTGIVYDARTDVYKGLIETAGKSASRFVAPGDLIAGLSVVRVDLDGVVVQGGGKEFTVPVGGTFLQASASGGDGKSGSGAAAGDGRTDGASASGSGAGDESATGETNDKLRSVLERLRHRSGRPPR
jgi:hypothetical protein